MWPAQWMPLITTRDYRMPAQESATEFPRASARPSAIGPAPVALESPGRQGPGH
jgi:hypothetical protein